ncbi:MAG: hypothetical protein P8Z00_00125 [Anaerolineales bacterium]|jgi:hypothetical protein
MEFLLTASIAKPPADVFAFFRDIDQLPWETHPVVAAYEKSTPGPAGVGSRYCERVRLFAEVASSGFFYTTATWTPALGWLPLFPDVAAQAGVVTSIPG